MAKKIVMSQDQDILIRNGFIEILAEPYEELPSKLSPEIATILANLATYGYTLDHRTFKALYAQWVNDGSRLGDWWKEIKTVLDDITGKNRNMGEFMVYKNFPREVLDMTAAEQALKQFMIYVGVPYKWVAAAAVARPILGEMQNLKVLTLSDASTRNKIFYNLEAMPNRWSDNQIAWAKRLIGTRNAIVMKSYGFKENGIQLAAANFEAVEFEPSSATDVLRLVAAVSGGDVSLRNQKFNVKKFSREQRRRVLGYIESQTNLADDFAMRPALWKKILRRLHPGDYVGKGECANVLAAYDDLYHGRTKRITAQLDPQKPHDGMLGAARTRPGEFLRRLHHYYALFGLRAFENFVTVIPKLTTKQLVSLRGYMRTINDRVFLMSPPKANWTLVKIRPNRKCRIDPKHRLMLDTAISRELMKRLDARFPEGMNVDLKVDQIKLQTNDQKLAEYGRGTEFDIPDAVTFIRSASYWENDVRHSYTWFDNGWNFFDQNWKPLGVCSWDHQQFGGKNSGGWWNRKKDRPAGVGAIFSGDPINIRDLKGRACQMADLYIDNLRAAGVRFCVWGILCFSERMFSEATGEVLATLQMGENAEEGQVYEPSRAQMVFPLKSEQYTTYLAYLDLDRRKIVYMDAPLRSSTRSATYNQDRLAQLMPAYVEYLDSLPTVLEVVQDVPAGKMPVLFSDTNVPIHSGRAFVFRAEASGNTFERVTVTDLVKND